MLNAKNEYGKRIFKKIRQLKSNHLLNGNQKLFDKVKKLLKDYSPLIISEKFLKKEISYGTIYTKNFIILGKY